MSDSHSHVGYKVYYWTWGWLGVLTIIALIIGEVEMPRMIKAGLLVITSLAKIGLIAAIFMHLRFERMNLIMITIIPLILAVIMFFMVTPDTINTASRILALR